MSTSESRRGRTNHNHRLEPLESWDIQHELAGYKDRGCYVHPAGCLTCDRPRCILDDVRQGSAGGSIPGRSPIRTEVIRRRLVGEHNREIALAIGISTESVAAHVATAFQLGLLERPERRTA